MKTKLLPFLLLLSTLAVMCLAPALRAFDGKLTMTITNAKSGDEPRTFTFAFKGELFRTDFTPQPDSRAARMGPVATIVDRGNHQLTMLMLDKKIYMVHPMSGKTEMRIGDNLTQLEYRPTGQKATIAGVDAVQYTATAVEDGSFHEVWVTPELGKFLEENQGVGASADPGDLTAQSLWTQFAFKENFIILRAIIYTTKGGAEKFHLEVTNVDRTPQPDSVFQVPADFKKMDMPFRAPDAGMGMMN